MSNQHTGKAKTRLSHLAFAMLIEEMVAGPCTVRELVDYTGLKDGTVWLLLRAMHDRKAIHISGWEKDAKGRWAIKVYSLGVGRDVKKPKKPNSESCREWRARQKLVGARAMFDGAANDEDRRVA